MLLPAITLSLCGQRRQIDRLNCGEGKTFFYGKRGFSPHLPHLSYPYSRKRALHFCRRQKASHCEAMLHDGCNPSLHILTPPLSKKARYFADLPAALLGYNSVIIIISLLAKRALHFCRRQKASHCEAMLHDGCNPSLHILPPPPFFEKNGVFAAPPVPP